MLLWMSVASCRFYDWKKRYGKANEHNGKIPRDYWLMEWEKQAIVDFKLKNPLNGTRRLAFMMNDADVVYASPKTVYRVLRDAGVLDSRNVRPSKKGCGFHQPSGAHRHWHTDVSYINICGTFYYLSSVLDGYSRYIVHWEIREQMKETDIEVIIQRALEKHPGVKPRLISDNGPQYVSREFKQFVRLSGMDHVRTSPYYPQSNGKIERWHRELKETCIRAQTISDLDDARQKVHDFVDHYNNIRLHASLGYISPKDKLAGREREIHARRDRNLEAARDRRRLMRRGEQPIENEPARGYGSAGGQPERLSGRGKRGTIEAEEALASCAESEKPQGVWGAASPKVDSA